MTGISHFLIGSGNVLIAIILSGEKSISTVSLSYILGATASILPDIDAENSMLQHYVFSYGKPAIANAMISYRFRKSIIGSLFYALLSATELLIRHLISFPFLLLKLFVRHRGVTHTLLAAIILTISLGLFTFVFKLSYLLALCFFIGYITHILLDAFTISGVQLFRPFSKKTIYLLPSKRRFRTKSIEELWWVLGWGILWIILVMIFT